MSIQGSTNDTWRLESFAALGHELGGPLTALGGALEVLRDSLGADLAPRSLKMLGVCDRALDRLGDTLTQVRDLTGLASGQVPLARETIAVAELARCLVLSLESASAEHRLAFDTDYPAGLVDVDPARTVQALGHLIGRALAASPPETTVTVRLEAGSGHIRFRVRDQGPPLPVERLGDLFQPFRHLLADATDRPGLEFSVSRVIAELQGGRVWAANAPGGGCDLWLELPISAPLSTLPVPC